MLSEEFEIRKLLEQDTLARNYIDEAKEIGELWTFWMRMS